MKYQREGNIYPSNCQRDNLSGFASFAVHRDEATNWLSTVAYLLLSLGAAIVLGLYYVYMKMSSMKIQVYENSCHYWQSNLCARLGWVACPSHANNLFLRSLISLFFFFFFQVDEHDSYRFGSSAAGPHPVTSLVCLGWSSLPLFLVTDSLTMTRVNAHTLNRPTGEYQCSHNV